MEILGNGNELKSHDRRWKDLKVKCGKILKVFFSNKIWNIKKSLILQLSA
jgi:hypothetical protein